MSMDEDGDGVMRRGGTDFGIGGDDDGSGLASSKIESARRFLYDEDEPTRNVSRPSTKTSGSSVLPPPSSILEGGGSTNLSSSQYKNDNNNSKRGRGRGTNTLVASCLTVMSTCHGRHGKQLLYGTVFVGIMMLCIWGIVTLVGNNSNTADGNGKRINEFHAKIVESELSSKSDLETVGSPQYHAVQWLANTDGAKMKPNNEHAMQRYALAVLFYSTSGTDDHVHPEGKGTWINQKNWMTANGLCSWHGVLCKGQVDLDDDDGHDESKKYKNENNFVTVISLPSNGLDGLMVSEIGALTLLLKLDLSQNNLFGTLPKKLADLHELRDLVLRENDLTGVIPSDYGIKMSNMRQFNLGVNRLNGPIPVELEHMVGLRSLGLERNQFQGNIPDLEGMTQLTELYLESNNLDGTFPGSVSKLTSLVELNLSNNHLTGSLPFELAKLTHLEKIILNHLNLRGTLPSDLFKRVTRLTELSLQNNSFSGQIPTAIGFLKDVKGFYLGDNKFSGTIPREIGLMADLQQFQIHGNEIGGTIPNIISALNNLEGIQLSRNLIQGKIPPEISYLHRLVAIHFESNQLEGEIPSEIGNIKSLKQMRLYHNNLTGNVPDEVCLLTTEEELTYLGADCDDDGKVTCDCCTKCF